MTNGKLKIGYVFLTTLKIWGAAWIAFLVALVPVYIWRGAYHKPEVAARGENILMSVIGAVIGFVALMLIHGKSDEAERLTDKAMWIVAFGSVSIHAAAGVLLWVVGQDNNYPIAVCGYHLAKLFPFGATVVSALLSALIYGAFYVLAIVLGTKMAQRRRART